MSSIACSSSARHVRADDHVVERQERMVRRRRLDGQHVQPRAGQVARLQGLEQIGLVRPARRGPC